MTFKDGSKTGRDCPKCGKPLIFDLSFQDCWNSRQESHYTIDVPLVVCSDENCAYQEDYEKEEPEYEPDFEKGDDDD